MLASLVEYVPEALSILFMRFEDILDCRHCAGNNVLSILFMRFNVVGAWRWGCFEHDFQFSLWDSATSAIFVANIAHVLSILFMRFSGRRGRGWCPRPITFNSLYEILEAIDSCTPWSGNFQFSLWDSQLAKEIGLETNNKFFQFSLWDS